MFVCEYTKRISCTRPFFFFINVVHYVLVHHSDFEYVVEC